ncbi:MAG TPA: hypothetical protein VN441_04235 [Syntrophomonas sp.]|nr:hypothetical protein [Syntrophomonas sp.]
MHNYKITHITPTAARQQSIPQRLSDWYNRNFKALFDGCGASMLYVVGLSAITVVVVLVSRAMGW